MFWVLFNLYAYRVVLLSQRLWITPVEDVGNWSEVTFSAASFPFKIILWKLESYFEFLILVFHFTSASAASCWPLAAGWPACSSAPLAMAISLASFSTSSLYNYVEQAEESGFWKSTKAIQHIPLVVHLLGFFFDPILRTIIPDRLQSWEAKNLIDNPNIIDG